MHDEDVVAPLVVESLPAAQAMQVLLVEAPTVVEYLPTPQLVQTELEVAARVVEYWPAVHLVQTEDPPFEAYVPASQSMQALATVAPVV